MYAADSFFTLTAVGQAGLAVLSLVLAALVVLGARAATRARRGPVRLAMAVLAFLLFVWLSPQVYYAYYRMIIDGLPAQWVIGAPPSPKDLARLATFSGRTTLSAHGLGLLFWALVLSASLPPGQGRSGTRP